MYTRARCPLHPPCRPGSSDSLVAFGLTSSQPETHAGRVTSPGEHDGVLDLLEDCKSSDTNARDAARAQNGKPLEMAGTRESSGLRQLSFGQAKIHRHVKVWFVGLECPSGQVERGCADSHAAMRAHLKTRGACRVRRDRYYYASSPPCATIHSPCHQSLDIALDGCVSLFRSNCSTGVQVQAVS